MEDVIKILTSLPSTDGNFKSALKRADLAELDEAIGFIEQNPIGQIARKYAILSEKKRRKREEKEQQVSDQMDIFQMEETSSDSQRSDVNENGFNTVSLSELPEQFKDTGSLPDSNDESKDNSVFVPMGKASLFDIVTHNLPKPTDEEIQKARNADNDAERPVDIDVVDTSYVDFALSIGGETDCSTYDRAAEVLRKEMVSFSDDENLYVLHGLLKAIKEDADLAAGVLRKGKSYRKAFNYFSKKSQEYGIKLESCYWLTKEQALPLAIEYYKIDEEEQKRIKEAEDAVRKESNQKPAAKRKSRTPKSDKTKEKVNAKNDVKDCEKDTTKADDIKSVISTEIPDMSVPKPQSDDNSFLTKFENFSFDGGGQLSFI